MPFTTPEEREARQRRSETEANIAAVLAAAYIGRLPNHPETEAAAVAIYRAMLRELRKDGPFARAK